MIIDFDISFSSLRNIGEVDLTQDLFLCKVNNSYIFVYEAWSNFPKLYLCNSDIIGARSSIITYTKFNENILEVFLRHFLDIGIPERAIKYKAEFFIGYSIIKEIIYNNDLEQFNYKLINNPNIWWSSHLWQQTIKYQ